MNKRSDLTLQQRRRGLANLLPPAEETLRGSLIERYVTCGNRSCKYARGERYGPVWYLTTTLGPGQTTSAVVPSELLQQVRHELSQGEGGSGEDLGNQPRTVAPRTEEEIQEIDALRALRALRLRFDFRLLFAYAIRPESPLPFRRTTWITKSSF